MPSARGGDRREVVVLALCLLASGALFVFGGRVETTSITRFELAVLWPANQTRDFVESVLHERRQNELLKTEVVRLRAERLQLLRAGAEAERLRRTLRFVEPRLPVLLPAAVVGVAGEPWPLVFHLSVGVEDGVRVGQAVVAPEGLVGRVAEVGRGHAAVTLITDPALAVGCEVLPEGARGVLRFRGEERPGLYLNFVPLTDTVRVGQEVATSGLSSLFPEGLPVGAVARVGRDPNGLVQEIQVRPYAPLTRLREVFVVVGTEPLRPWSLQVPALPESVRAVASAAVPPLVPPAAPVRQAPAPVRQAPAAVREARPAAPAESAAAESVP